MKKYNYFVILCLLLVNLTVLGQNNAIRVTIIRPSQNANFDGKLSNLVDIGNQLHATLQQVSNQGFKRINILATLSNTDESIKITALTNTSIELQGTIPFNLFGTELTNFFDAGSIETIGIDQNDLITGGFVPEGFYKLCVIIFDADIADGYTAQLSNPDISGCITLRTQYAEPPRLTNIGNQPVMPVSEGVVVPTQLNPFNIQWTPAIVAGSSVNYKLEIADMGDISENAEVADLDPNISFQNNPFALYELNGIGSPLAVVGVGGQLNATFELTHRYAVRVQAVAINGATIKNNGYSQVASFWFGEQTMAKQASPGLYPITGYPQQGYLPYRGMPMVVRIGGNFDPEKQTIIRFDSKFQITRDDGQEVRLDRTLKWYSKSPLATQQFYAKANPPLVAEQARRIVVSHATNDPVYNHYYRSDMVRGKTYNWNALVTLTERLTPKSHENQIDQSVSGSFIFGMDKPLPSLPLNKSTQEKGEIAFKYQTSAPHDTTGVMLHDIVQAEEGNLIGSFDVSVLEKAILEVSTVSDFGKMDSIKYVAPTITFNRELLNSKKNNERINWSSEFAGLYNEQTTSSTFTKDGTYYWRIKWLSNPERETDTTSYNSSEIWQFTIGEPTTTTTKDSIPPKEILACEQCDQVDLPSGPSALVKVGSYVRVGHFIMEVSEIAGSSGSYSGNGTIFDFELMGYTARLNVNFTGLSAASVMEQDVTFLKAKTGEVKTLSRGNEMLTLIELVNDQPLSLPLGIDFMMSGHHIVLQLDKIVFSPTKAMATVKAAWQPPLDIADGQPFSVSARDVCILPGRFGHEATFVLDHNITVNQGSAYEFSFSGDPSGNNYLAATFLQIKCDTVSIQLAGELAFPRTTLIPVTSKGKIIEGAEKVSGLFKLRLDRYAHIEKINEPAETETGMIAQFGFNHPFQVAGMDGWDFTVTNAALDLSDLGNPLGMQFPQGYVFSDWFPAGSPPNMRNLWRGVYCKDIMVRVPKDLTLHDEDEEGMQFQLQHLIIDKTGVTLSIVDENVLAMGGAKWDFSIDDIALSLVQTRTLTGTMKGKLRLPNFDENNFLGYDMMVSSADSKPAYSCSVKVQDGPLKMSLFVMDMTLDPTSHIQFEVGRREPGKRGLRLKGELNGYLGIQENPVIDKIDDLMDMKINLVKFEKFGFDTDSTKFFTFKHANYTNSDGTNPVLAFASPQHSAGRLPISITGFDFVEEEGKPGLKIGAALNLSDMGFKATLGFTIFGNFELEKGIIPKNVSYDHTRLDSIIVDGEFGGFKLHGGIVYYNKDSYKGFKGDIAATMPMGLSGRLTADFGSRGTSGNADYFRYWYVDGMVYLPNKVPPITIGPIEIKGFGGGAWYHMKLVNPDAMTREAAASKAQELVHTDEPNPKDVPISGLTFTPDKSMGLGLSVAFVGALVGNNTVFNMDVALKVEFTTDWGLKQASLIGNGYLLQDLDKRENPSIKAKVDLTYAHQGGDWQFAGNLQVTVDMAHVLVGAHDNNLAGEAQLYFDHTGKWYFKLGQMEVDKRIALKAQIGHGGLSMNMNTYLMVGHDIPTELPALPAFIETLLSGATGDTGNLTGGTLNNGNLNRGNRAGDMQNYKEGKGLAFGAQVTFDYDNSFLFFYASLKMAVGADINFAKPTSAIICGDNGPRGFNGGWYAQGQAYAGFEGEFGIEIDLLFFSGKYAIASVGAAIGMEFKTPNPTYMQGRAGLRYALLGGRIKGQCNYAIEYGEKCDASGAFGDIQFISEMRPDCGSIDIPTGSKIYTVFNFPMDEEFELEEQSGNNINVRKFEPFIATYTIKKAVKDSLLSATKSYQNERIVGLLTPNEYLESTTKYQAYVEVQVNETTSGARVLVNNTTTNQPFKEKQTTGFTTGVRPKTIDLENEISWPIANQRYFLQNEGLEPQNGEVSSAVVQKKGFIKTRQKYLFSNGPDGEYASNATYPPSNTMASMGRKVMYYASFTSTSSISVGGKEMETGDALKTPLTYFDMGGAGGAIEFDLPSLVNSSNYKLKIIRNVTGSGGDPTMAQAGSIEPKVTSSSKSSVYKNANQQINATVITKVNKLDGVPLEQEPANFIMTSYMFGTSKFNNHREKLNATFTQDVSAGASTTWKLDGGEPFEVGDFVTSPSMAISETGLEKNGVLMYMGLPDWTRMITDNNLHEKFGKFNNIYKAYQPFEIGFTKYFQYNSVSSPSGGNFSNRYPTNNELLTSSNNLNNEYLALSPASSHRIKSVAKTPVVGVERALFTSPYFAKESSLAKRLGSGSSNGLAGSAGMMQTVNTASLSGSGSPRASMSTTAFSNAGVAMSSDGGGGPTTPSGGGSITLIRDKTNSLIQENITYMTQKLEKFYLNVPKSIDFKVLYQKIATIKPLTQSEWELSSNFYQALNANGFLDAGVTAPPNDFLGKQGNQPILFIFMVPTRLGSYSTAPILKVGTQYIR